MAACLPVSFAGAQPPFLHSAFNSSAGLPVGSFMWKSLRELCDPMHPTTFPNPDQWPLSNPEGLYILTLINSGDMNAPAHLIAVGITRGRSGWVRQFVDNYHREPVRFSDFASHPDYEDLEVASGLRLVEAVYQGLARSAV